MPRTQEVRKECPSCGLGVSLDAKVCEFCGWDFEEEDEWILQIEKLEQELMIEKQRFEETTVEKRIKSTLRPPETELAEEPSVAPAKKRTVKRRVAAGAARERKAPSAKIEAPELEIAKAEEEAEQVEEALPDLDDLDLPPPPEDYSPPEEMAEESPQIVKERPEMFKQAPEAAPKPGGQKKVRRVVTRTVKTSMKPEVASAKVAAAKRPIGKARPSGEPDRRAKATTAKRKAKAKAAIPSDAKGKKPAPSTKAKITRTRRVTRSVKTKPPVSEKKHVPTMRVFICPLCKAEVSEEADVCSNCGAKFA